MKLYFAGANSELELFSEMKVEKLLIAYPFAKRHNFYNEKMFIDSGAFTVFNTGKKIDILEYCRWLKENNVKIYAALDVIGDEKKTRENFDFMISYGLKPIPTFHFGENFDCLKYYLEKCDYIALGGLVPQKNNVNKIKNFLNKCFLLGKSTKFHGFGVNNFEILKKYPFYSVDATSWHNPMRYGQNFVFKDGNLKRTSHKKITYDKVLSKKEKLKQAITEFLKVEDYITRLWEIRGIKWD